ncbi:MULTISPECIES: sugar ABC transporter substrate-binding protein [unclassified Crossiella]|uniref:ABC transporter substrate-binding protein n=1 Tax=unclassified Crossiella TaxID=2620835 RepID=UPI001FFF7F70|nr:MULTISPECIES: sugar ABC transporter substrate-binding protein [unclassified Crossiella]MCK2241518.1 sugar ABC transporter substrate-binding protein [Crossiella sp. S99.2]MCK2255610.1 sugar ABC transporter substrate-binding protein [Crossiella sp. S99.1]
MRLPGLAAVGLILFAVGLSGCDPAEDRGGSGTLTYWASNQSASLDRDREILTPRLAEFTRRTGIEVELEVIPWSDLLNRILAAASSGQGPDVLNIGNTWSASLQASGALLPFDEPALAKVGGRDRFLPSTLTSTGAAGQPPAAVPLYGLAYGLYYSRKRFAEAGISAPPGTWAEFLDTARKLTEPAKDRWGLGIMGSSYTSNAHLAFIFGRQHGATLFEGNRSTVDSPQLAAGIGQYLDLVAGAKVVNPGNAEYQNDTQPLKDFATGRTAMVMLQSHATMGLHANGMAEQDYGVAPIPVPDPLPPGGKRITSHVAGINLGVFADTDNTEGALKFVEFMTSPDTQRTVNAALGSLPVATAAYDDPRFQGPVTRTFREVLAGTAETMPMIPQEAQFETLVGTAVKDLLAKVAGGGTVAVADIRAELAAVDERMRGGG